MTPALPASSARLAPTSPGRSRPEGRMTRAALWLAAAGLLVVLGAPLAPQLARFEYLVVAGGSMEPTIPVGSVVVAQAVDPAELRVGDIATYVLASDPSTVVTHRIVALERPGGELHLHTRGDANPVEDTSGVDLSRPVSRVVAWVPAAGYLVEALGDPATRLILFGGLCLLSWSILRHPTSPTARRGASSTST